MKKLISFILIAVAFAFSANNQIQQKITKSIKSLKNCSVYVGEEALNWTFSEAGKEMHKDANAVYYWCDNGDFLYVQDDLNGSVIRGHVCKNGHYDYVNGCPKASSWFEIMSIRDSKTFSFKSNSSGHFLEDDDYGIRIEDVNFSNEEFEFGQNLMLGIYKNFKKKIKRSDHSDDRQGSRLIGGNNG